MALDFPATPSNGQQFTSGGTVWTWDSQKWVAGATTSAFAPVNSPVFTGDPQAPQPAAGDADASIATTKFVSDAVATSLHDVGRNYLHNSMFNIAQRGAGSFSATGNTLDRWYLFTLLDTGLGFQQYTAADADRAAIGDEAATAFLASGSIVGNGGAGASTSVQQHIEGVRRLAGKTVTVSFWANASPVAKLGVSIDQSFGTGGSPSTAVTGNGQPVQLTAGWARYSVTFAIPSAAGKTLGTNRDDYTGLNFWYSSGATNNVRAGGIGVQSSWINLWGVQLELGTVATPLEKLDPVTQLQQCQRFFQIGSFYMQQNQIGGGTSVQRFPLNQTMRAIPTVTPTQQTSVNATSQALSASDPSTMNISVAAVAAGVFAWGGTYTASADL